MNETTTRAPRDTIEALIQNASMDAMQGEDTQARDALDGAADALAAWDAMLDALRRLADEAESNYLFGEDGGELEALDLAREAIRAAEGGA